ncbi:hypothetical protein HMN09_00101000 [Mycena chlorophos]|uniref:Uncharacterized protein n=1 Tax=Mycena chlorophos TaxID=658473 RepID=A0A8H6WLN7_MYCCL|nr:hypothetical protein HMN09_00101000 [Mycena chlorophos]
MDHVDTLARRMRSIFALPAFRSPPAPSNPTTDDNTPPTPLPEDGRPLPPADAVRIQDPELISLLSTPEIMNGDGRRQSVWSMLDDYSPQLHAGSDSSSVMMYSPLIPTNESVIELAEIEVVPVPAASSAGWFSFLPAFWPFTSWSAATPAPTPASEDADATPRPSPTVLSLESSVSSVLSSPERVAVRHVWVPSTTKLSFEATWWGYRIYIPPPAMEILDDQSIEAARQATLITSALTWFFSNLPLASFPPPMQPAILLLQRLVPLVSYLGTFISWSWGAIRSFDKGHGIILTATWLLPPALIPSTWHARDFPAPSTPVSPASNYTPLLIFSPQLASSPSLPLVPEVEEVEEPPPPLPPAPKLSSVPLPPGTPLLPEPDPLPASALTSPDPARRLLSPLSPALLTPPSSASSTPKSKSRIKTIRKKLTRALSEHGLA